MPSGLGRRDILVAVGVSLAILIVGIMFGRSTALNDLNESTSENGLPTEASPQAASSDNQAFVAPAESVTIPGSAMTAGQQKALEFVGVDTNELVITPEMFACAETSIGSDRMTAIQNGDTPSVIEGAKLLTCYNQ